MTAITINAAIKRVALSEAIRDRDTRKAGEPHRDGGLVLTEAGIEPTASNLDQLSEAILDLQQFTNAATEVGDPERECDTGAAYDFLLFLQSRYAGAAA